MGLVAAGCAPPVPPTSPPPPPVPSPAPQVADAKAPESAADGAQLYVQNCQGCHGDRGQGVPSAGIALAEAGHEEEAELRSTILSGKGKMPGFQGRLTDAQITALISHLRTLPAASSGEGGEKHEGEKHEGEEKGEHKDRDGD